MEESIKVLEEKSIELRHEVQDKTKNMNLSLQEVDRNKGALDDLRSELIMVMLSLDL